MELTPEERNKNEELRKALDIKKPTEFELRYDAAKAELENKKDRFLGRVEKGTFKVKAVARAFSQKVKKKARRMWRKLGFGGSEPEFGELMEKVKEWNYEVIDKIGESGEVYKCKVKGTGEKVVIKVVQLSSIPEEGIDASIIREISLLKELNHNNIVRLLDVRACERPGEEGTSRGEKILFLVYEYLKYDLYKWLHGRKWRVEDRLTRKRYLRQILEGLAYCHAHKILHRNLKAENVLLDKKMNRVKLAGFGLSRPWEVPGEQFSPQVGKPVYQAPEVILGDSTYTDKADVWAAGCIFGEMVNGGRLFTNLTTNNLLEEICGVVGAPTEQTWPGRAADVLNRVKKKFETNNHHDITPFFLGLESEGVQLLTEMLQMDPNKRISASAALMHPYFARS